MLGKLGDWRLPMGPYTPPQLIIASVGAFVLIKTATWWAPTLGPLPVVVWAVAIWAARHSRVGGRSLGPAVMDAVALALAPRHGRIGGRAVRPVPAEWLSGGFGIEEALEDEPPVASAPAPAPVAAPPRSAAAKPKEARATRPDARRPRPPAPDTARRPQPRRGRKAEREETPPMRPAPTALELLLAQAASHSSTTHDTTGGKSR
ncbi:hypothetical protein [Kitasatospora sp. NPDC086791]|uniref:hypothetical protein n=1 Tax=Kitasatospora sp. NPDC086791 TaxID=3155178 RepID=UPI0034176E2D